VIPGKHQIRQTVTNRKIPLPISLINGQNVREMRKPRKRSFENIKNIEKEIPPAAAQVSQYSRSTTDNVTGAQPLLLKAKNFHFFD
jgi:hypothetical protein